MLGDVDLTVREGDRIGLVGENGSGKSTLLALLGQQRDPEAGEVTWRSGLRLTAVEQFINPDLTGLTTLDAVLDRTSTETGAARHDAEALLASLGFSTAELGYRVGDLSGGQQNRLMFARAIIDEPDVVLFDEPTNHLDIESILVFERAILALRAGFLLISHDRDFLDAVTTRTLFLRDERLYDYSMPYSGAAAQLAEDDAAAAERRRNQDRAIESLRASAKRIANWSRINESEKLARKARSMERRVERMEEDRTFVTRGSDLNLELDTGSMKAGRMLAIEQHRVAREQSLLFGVEHLVIRPGDRVALLGHNGVGKTTFIEQLVAAFAQDGQTPSVSFNPRCRLGYYDQELASLNPKRTLLDTVLAETDARDQAAVRALIHAGFAYREHGKPVSVLSGGERARLMFLCMRLNEPNFLILDEPTNHIDIAGKESLETQLIEASATLIITSHDRRFVDAVANRFVLISNGTLTELDRPETFYTQTLARSAPASAHNAETATTGPAAAENSEEAGSEEALLERLIELEALLEDDLARKPKFQKPQRQAQWREEIQHIRDRLP